MHSFVILLIISYVKSLLFRFDSFSTPTTGSESVANTAAVVLNTRHYRDSILGSACGRAIDSSFIIVLEQSEG